MSGTPESRRSWDRLEGFPFVGVELDAEYLEIARRRIDAVTLPIFRA